MRALSLLLGVVLGLLVAGIILVVLIASLPGGRITPATPSLAVSPAPSGSPSESASTPVPSTSASALPSASLGPSASASTAGVGLGVGQTAPALRVARLGGGTLDLAELRGKPVWVNFMASWCLPCRDELPLMERARRALGEEIEIVAVDVREDEATARAFADDLVLEMPVGLDEDGSVRDAWSAYAMPVHYWLDAEGVIRGNAFGGIGPDAMLDGIRSVVPDAQWEP
jgi:thiol-disulfide isomerase/thioredoxin